MWHKRLAALNSRTAVLLVIVCILAARGDCENFLQKCSQAVTADTFNVPETLREPFEPTGDDEDTYNDEFYNFPLLEDSLSNCTSALQHLSLNTSTSGSVFWTSTGHLVTQLWSYPKERHCISR